MIRRLIKYVEVGTDKRNGGRQERLKTTEKEQANNSTNIRLQPRLQTQQQEPYQGIVI